MTSYSTPAMVRQALVPSSDGTEPTTPTNTAADLTDAQLQDSIDEADSTIDSYIGAFYAVPVAIIDPSTGQPTGITPHPLDFWSRNIAAYVATLAYRGSQDFTDTDPVARRYKDTLASLQAVAAGKMKLMIPDNTSGNSAVAVAPAFNPYLGDLWDPSDFSLEPSLSPVLDPSERQVPEGFWTEPF